MASVLRLLGPGLLLLFGAACGRVGAPMGPIGFADACDFSGLPQPPQPTREAHARALSSHRRAHCGGAQASRPGNPIRAVYGFSAGPGPLPVMYSAMPSAFPEEIAAPPVSGGPNLEYWADVPIWALRAFSNTPHEGTAQFETRNPMAWVKHNLAITQAARHATASIGAALISFKGERASYVNFLSGSTVVVPASEITKATGRNFTPTPETDSAERLHGAMSQYCQSTHRSLAGMVLGMEGDMVLGYCDFPGAGTVDDTTIETLAKSENKPLPNLPWGARWQEFALTRARSYCREKNPRASGGIIQRWPASNQPKEKVAVVCYI